MEPSIQPQNLLLGKRNILLTEFKSRIQFEFVWLAEKIAKLNWDDPLFWIPFVLMINTISLKLGKFFLFVSNMSRSVEIDTSVWNLSLLILYHIVNYFLSD